MTVEEYRASRNRLLERLTDEIEWWPSPGDWCESLSRAGGYDGDPFRMTRIEFARCRPYE